MMENKISLKEWIGLIVAVIGTLIFCYGCLQTPFSKFITYAAIGGIILLIGTIAVAREGF